MNARAKGRNAEVKTQRSLEADGWLVERVKGGTGWQRSTDFFGMFDIIAVRAGEIRWIQVKCNRAASPAFRHAMGLFPAPGTKELWVWKDRVKSPTITTCPPKNTQRSTCG